MADAGTAQYAADQVTERLQRFSSQVRIALRVRDADAVHDLRVAIRRLLQTLETLQCWFVASHVKTICRQLTTLLTTAGGVRDCDIAIELLSNSGVEDINNIGRALHTRREAAQRRLAAALRRWTAQKLAARWRAELATIETPIECRGLSWDELARLELPRLAKTFFRSGKRAVKSKASAGDLHHLRIEAKELRYTLEMFQSTYPPTVETRITSLHDIQIVLGKINDVRAARKLLDDLDGGRKPAAMLRKKQSKRIARFGNLWETQFPPNQVKEWIHFLRQPVRKPVMRSGSPSSGKRAVSAK